MVTLVCCGTTSSLVLSLDINEITAWDACSCFTWKFMLMMTHADSLWCLTLSLSLSVDKPVGSERLIHPSLFWEWPWWSEFLPPRGSEIEDVRLVGLTTTLCVCDTLRTANASFKDLCGAVASAHRLAGGSDCQPATANHSHLHRWHKDVSANQVLHYTCGLRAFPEWDELQLCGGDVLCLVGEPQECSQGKEQDLPCWSTGPHKHKGTS